jgi:glutaminyl-peptide cyclotransferase
MSHHPKVAHTDHDVLEVIRHRWSPRAFDADRPLTRDEQHQLFEAARWAPSSGNEQPWQFLVADRFEQPAAFDRLLSTLSASNQTWAQAAPALILVSLRPEESRTGQPNLYASYDTGQAVAMLTLQATSMQLGVRQMAGFDKVRAREVCAVDPSFEPVVLMAVGHIGAVDRLPLERHRHTEIQPRARRKIAEFVKWLAVAIFAAAVSASAACQPATPAASAQSAAAVPPPTAPASAAGGAAPAGPAKQFGYRIVHTYPHDAKSFTQGLIARDGVLYESAGDFANSNLRKVELGTGKVLQQQKLSDPKMFAEGLTDWQGSLIQLTWQHGQGFVYDRASFAFQQSFRYSGEGWGLTHDDTRLILSDGTAAGGLRFLDPSTFVETGRVVVKDQGVAVDRLNELEFVDGEVFANVWHDDRIARIDPATGVVTGWIDLTGLLKPGEVTDPEAVLNGIAYDAAAKRLFVTGKLWPKLFEITLVPK